VGAVVLPGDLQSERLGVDAFAIVNRLNKLICANFGFPQPQGSRFTGPRLISLIRLLVMADRADVSCPEQASEASRTAVRGCLRARVTCGAAEWSLD
jgi:hypothetical protein